MLAVLPKSLLLSDNFERSITDSFPVIRKVASVGLVANDALYGHVYFTYGATGKLESRTDANGNVTRMEYDQKDRLTAVTDGNGSRTRYEFDALDRLIAVTNAAGGITKFKYDALGRRTEVLSPGNRKTTFDVYDANGNLIKSKNANANKDGSPLNSTGATVTSAYDQMNRMVSAQSAENGTSVMTYDLLGNMTSITDAENRTTTLIYDDLGRLFQMVDPIVETPTDKVFQYNYDQMDNVVSTWDRDGRIIRYNYDKNNRLTQVQYATDNKYDYFTYDQYGDLITASNSNATYTYTYDAQHRQKSKTDGRNNKVMSFAYDAVGNLASQTDYQGDVTNYQYDGNNRLAGISSTAYEGMSYQYDAQGRLAAKIWSSGARISYEYDADSRVVGLRQVSASGTVINDSDYLYDEIGNIKTETLAGGETISYTYDPVGRLLTANYSNPAIQDITYTYDKVGNRKTAQIGTATVYYLYNNAGNRLDKTCSALNAGQTDCATGAQINRYAYDNHGKMIDKYDAADTQVAHYNWNQRGLITSDVTAGATTSYLYDAHGYRIKKTNPDATANQYLLSGEHLEAVYDGSGNLQASYQRGQFIDEIVSANVKANGRMVHQVYLQGMVGSVDAITDANGSVTQSTRYLPFGEQISQTGTAANTMLYAGREKDASSGLYYNRARYYDAGIGRFISEDPIGLNGGINMYAYVQNNPLIYSDPRGLYLVASSLVMANVWGDSQFWQDVLPGWASVGVGLSPAGVVADGYTLFTGKDYFDKSEVSDLARWAILIPGVSEMRQGAKAAEAVGEAAQNSEKLYHYTSSVYASTIADEGLKTGISSGKVFTTTDGTMSGLQAQVDLALPPTKPVPDAVFEIDVGVLKEMGINIPEATKVQRDFNMPGGGEEVIFDHMIPPEAIRRVK